MPEIEFDLECPVCGHTVEAQVEARAYHTVFFVKVCSCVTLGLTDILKDTDLGTIVQRVEELLKEILAKQGGY